MKRSKYFGYLLHEFPLVKILNVLDNSFCKDASIKFLEILTHIQNQPPLEMLQRNAADKTLFKTPRQIEKLKFLSVALKTLFCYHCDKYYEGYENH